MKHAFIIHRWGGSPKADWYPWLAEQLESKGFSVVVPEMPDTENPVIEKWVGKLKQLAKNPDKETYFIGHSIGCQTILRYLESANQKVGGVVLVAPWTHLIGIEDDKESKEIAAPWINKPIKWNKVKEHCNNFICIFSDNDPYVPLSEAELFRKHLNAEIIIEKTKGHFTQDDGITEIHAVLNELIRISF